MEKIVILCVAIAFGVFAASFMLIVYKLVAYIGKAIVKEPFSVNLKREIITISLATFIISLYFLTN